MPYGEHVEVAFCEGKALVFCTGQPKAKCQNGEREGEETGNDEEQRPQSETAEGKKEKEKRDHQPNANQENDDLFLWIKETIPLLLVLITEVEEAWRVEQELHQVVGNQQHQTQSVEADHDKTQRGMAFVSVPHTAFYRAKELNRKFLKKEINILA